MQNNWQHQQVNYYGLKAHRFDNGINALVVVPDLSGRAMYYGPVEGPNLLYERVEELALIGQNKQNWRNYGGYKCWLAPQELTGWPPNPNIDGAPFDYNLSQNETGFQLDLQGQPASNFGIRIRLSYQLNHNETTVTVLQGFENISDKTVEWSAWDVTQVPAPGQVLLPFGQIYNFPQFNFNPPISFHDNFQRVSISGQPPEFKLGLQFNSETSQPRQKIIFRPENSNLQYIKTFEAQPDKKYPHNNTIEVYNCHIMPYGEIEVNSPVVTVEPGESYLFRIVWSIVRN